MMKKPVSHTISNRRSAAAATVFLLLFIGLLAPTSWAQSFSIEDVMSAPFPDGLVSARDTEAIAWVSNEEGKRNVWIARGPDWQGKQITDFTQDDGQVITGLELAADGSWITWVRGDGGNRDGWTAAPAQPVEGAQRTRYLTHLTGEKAGNSLELPQWGVLSPDGTQLAWVHEDQIRIAPFTGEAIEPDAGVVIASPRRGASTLRWAPDGSRIAFVSTREAHSYVGVAEADGSSFRFLDPYVTLDGEPTWSPDSQKLAFLRGWRFPSKPFEPRRTDAIPWKIMIADVQSGEVGELFTAKAGAGSRFSGVVANQQLWWTKDDHIVFPWERGGWRRLWSISSEGGEPSLLLEGEHVVQHAALARDQETMLFDSNVDDINRKHIWRARADGSSTTDITPGQGVEWAPVSLASGAVAWIGSTATTPARVAVLPGSGEKAQYPRGLLPKSFPKADLVTPEAVMFKATDGMMIHGQLFLPPNLKKNQTAPALMFLHGGSRRQMLLGFHNRGYYHNAYAMNQWLAAKGYVVLAINYRSGVGYGLDFREAEDYGATGASEVRDVIGAGLWLASREDVDASKIGLWGGSYGGYLTAHGLTQAPDLFAAGVDIHGVHDWNEGIHNFRRDYVPELEPEFSELAFKSSPLFHMDRWEDPVLLIHGDDDRNVKFSETITLARELTLRDIPHDVLVLPDEVHGFLMHQSWISAYRATAEWFDRWMGP